MTMKPPWRRRQPIEDAMSLACNVRDIDPTICHQALLLWDEDRVVQTLLAAAAMIDVERPESELLMWDRRVLRGACKRGHPRTPRTTRIDPNGSLRCRVCERQRRAQLRRGAKRQRVRKVAA